MRLTRLLTTAMLAMLLTGCAGMSTGPTPEARQAGPPPIARKKARSGLNTCSGATSCRRHKPVTAHDGNQRGLVWRAARVYDASNIFEVLGFNVRRQDDECAGDGIKWVGE